jgi:alkylation response protein AidB-like acyl-CoA dehydrogenase
LTPALTAHLDRVDLVVCIETDGLSIQQPAALETIDVRRALDPLTSLQVVVKVGDGERLGGAALVATWDREAAVLTAAMQVGIARAVLDRTVSHAKAREQFGRAIGSQQAVKHRLADMLVRLTVARAATLAAAVLSDDPEVGDADRAASVAKLLADDAAVENSLAAVQLHGGMGFAWEVDVHLYLKRAWANAQAWGTADDHAERQALGI